MNVASVIKTLVLAVLFLILAVANINNIIRHHKEKKAAKRKKEIGGFTVMKQMKPEDAPEEK